MYVCVYIYIYIYSFFYIVYYSILLQDPDVDVGLWLRDQILARFKERGARQMANNTCTNGISQI